MARIIATGVPEKYQYMGEIRVTVEGTATDINDISFEENQNGKWIQAPQIETQFDIDMEKGPSYPLCAEPETMRRALFVLFEWFGEAESCWIEEPKHVKIEGEIEPMESEPGVVY